ncbi:hypothetical protein BaRGS_00004674 [Batillaria attramentaria]|uniref:Uncharacterized protein n=1 Tax=Batillaria attramentaria TaxID=370345 RepID=A0ABD0LWP2_9CAEN
METPEQKPLHLEPLQLEPRWLSIRAVRQGRLQYCAATTTAAKRVWLLGNRPVNFLCCVHYSIGREVLTAQANSRYNLCKGRCTLVAWPRDGCTDTRSRTCLKSKACFTRYKKKSDRTRTML